MLILNSASRANPYEPANVPHMVELGEASAVQLGGHVPLRLKVLLAYEIVPLESASSSWIVRTTSYNYSLMYGDAGELIAYHWHPPGLSRVTTPHLHIGPAIAGTSNQIGQRFVHRMHFPTGLVPLSSIIRLAIEEFGVRPLRDDWQQVLVQEGAA